MADASNTGHRRRFAIVDSASVLGAVTAALCCAGTPLLVGALGAVGLSFLRRDSILWPIMLVSLAIALWGFWEGWRSHRKPGPLLSGAIGATSLATGVTVVHGPPAMEMIYGGALVLVAATVWNIVARTRTVTAA